MRAATTTSARWVPALVAAALLVSARPAAAQAPTEVPEAVQREVQAAQDELARAVAEFEGPQQSRSIVALDGVIARLEAVGPRALPPRGRDILVQAYEYRGRAYFGIGLSEKASENFRQLVQLKPDHALSKETVSPKVVDLFNNVKRALVGYLAVSSQPAGAQVTLVGSGGARTDLGLTDFFPIEVLSGDYTVEIARPGYQTETRPVAITARDTQTLEVPLVRVLASVFFVTEPAGVEVWVDGELKVTTSGSLAPELHEEVRARGLDPAKASARTEVANLSLGSHAVELRRKCYETVKRTLDTPQPQDVNADPVKMEDSVASLRLTSDPPGARILLNGEARGVTPAQIDGICSGKVRVEVKHAAGQVHQGPRAQQGREHQPRLPDPAHPRLPRAWRPRAPPASGTSPTPSRRSSRTSRGSSRSTSSSRRARPWTGSSSRTSSPGWGSCPAPAPTPTSSARRPSAWPAPSRCRASSWPCCPRSGCSARRGSTCWPPGTPRPRRWTW